VFSVRAEESGSLDFDNSRLNAEMGAAIIASTQMLWSLYYGRIQKRTGRSAASIEQFVVGAGSSHVTGYVGSDYIVNLFLELGTSAHLILPAVKKALWWPGLARPVSRVNHPGTIPYLHLTRSGPVAGAIAKQRLAAAFARAFG
jgi:hypothetical protein